MEVNYWELATALTQARMATLAGLLVPVRHDALAGHEPNKGDSNWGLGCRVYDRSRNSIIAAAEEHDWLTIIDPSLHFVFAVGGIPIRFAHGDSEQPKARLLRRQLSEFQAQQLAFDALDPAFIEARWRLIIETDGETMAVAQVVLIQARGNGEVSNSWRLDAGLTAVPVDLRKTPPAVQLPKPEVRLKANPSESSTAQHA